MSWRAFLGGSTGRSRWPKPVMILALPLFCISSAYRPSARKNYMVPYISKVNKSKTYPKFNYLLVYTGR